MSRLIDVAERAGVSKATASKVLSGKALKERIAEDAIKRVQKAAKDLNYRPNYRATSLATGKSMVLGLVLADIKPHTAGHLFWRQCSEHLEIHAQNAGYDILCIRPVKGATDHSVIKRAQQYADDGRVDGLIVPGFLMSAKKHTFSVPHMCIEATSTNSQNNIQVNAEPGLKAALSFLAKQSHKNIMIRLQETNKLKIAKKHAQNLGLDLQLHKPNAVAQVSVQEQIQSVQLEWSSIFSNPSEQQNTDAIIGMNDVDAIACRMAQQKRGLNKTIISNDNLLLPTSPFTMPSICYPFDAVAAAAIQSLIGGCHTPIVDNYFSENESR